MNDKPFAGRVTAAALFLAAERLRVSQIALLINAGASTTEVNDRGETPLLAVVRSRGRFSPGSGGNRIEDGNKVRQFINYCNYTYRLYKYTHVD